MGTTFSDDEQGAYSALWHVRVSWILQRANVHHVMIKGMTWHPLLRSSRMHAPVDIDVLVGPSDLQRAVQALRNAGLDDDLPGVAFAEVSLHSVVLSAPTSPQVDVHLSFPGLDSDPSKTWDHFFRERTWVRLAGHEIPTASRECQVLLAAAAAARDGGNSRAAERMRAYLAKEHLRENEIRLAWDLHAADTLRVCLVALGKAAIADELGLPFGSGRFGPHATRGEKRMEEILAQPWSRRSVAIYRELWPTRAFLKGGEREAPMTRYQHLQLVAREGIPAFFAVAKRRLAAKRRRRLRR